MPETYFSGKEMRVQVPEKEHGLKEHEADKPDMSSPA